jgi:hypothetical protein
MEPLHSQFEMEEHLLDYGQVVEYIIFTRLHLEEISVREPVIEFETRRATTGCKNISRYLLKNGLMGKWHHEFTMASTHPYSEQPEGYLLKLDVLSAADDVHCAYIQFPYLLTKDRDWSGAGFGSSTKV